MHLVNLNPLQLLLLVLKFLEAQVLVITSAITVGVVVVIQQSMSIVDSLIDLITPLDLVTHLL